MTSRVSLQTWQPVRCGLWRGWPCGMGRVSETSHQEKEASSWLMCSNILEYLRVDVGPLKFCWTDCRWWPCLTCQTWSSVHVLLPLACNRLALLVLLLPYTGCPRCSQMGRLTHLHFHALIQVVGRFGFFSTSRFSFRFWALEYILSNSTQWTVQAPEHFEETLSYAKSGAFACPNA